MRRNQSLNQSTSPFCLFFSAHLEKAANPELIAKLIPDYMKSKQSTSEGGDASSIPPAIDGSSSDPKAGASSTDTQAQPETMAEASARSNDETQGQQQQQES
ncbi:hypothetical protein ACTXT7_006293 [Hymenolepis weldensis]